MRLLSVSSGDNQQKLFWPAGNGDEAVIVN